MGFLSWLFGETKEPDIIFCSACGEKVVREYELIGYNNHTGEEITQFVIKCPKGTYYNNHFWWTKNPPVFDP